MVDAYVGIFGEYFWVTNARKLKHLRLVMCGPGLACKPRLGPGLRQLQLSQMLGQAKALTHSLAQAWLGLSPGFGRGAHASCLGS